MIRYLIPLFIFLTLLGCKDLGVEPAQEKLPLESDGQSVPEVIWVTFTDGTTVEQPQQLVKDLGLSFNSVPTGTPLKGFVLVPVGSEDEWVVKFKTYPIVKSAGRIWLVHFTA